jgi:hypothetical protein
LVLEILKATLVTPIILFTDKKSPVSTPTRIEMKPYRDSPEYRVAEVYRGIEIQVAYCYLVNATKTEETLGWRFSLPDASYWMYKFATPEEAFLKARETVDFRLQEGTLVPSSEPKLISPVLSQEENLPEESALASPTAPTPVYEPIADRAVSGKWNRRASWGLGLAIVGTIFTWSQLKESHGISNAFLFLILIPINWAGVYGSWSFLLWLFRCITFNRSKKPLWNLRAGWAVFLALVVVGFVTIYCYYETNLLDDAEKATAQIIEIIVSFPYAIFFFYGMMTGLSYLRRSRSKILWTFAGLFLTLIIIVATLYGGQMLGQLPKFLNPVDSAEPQLSSSATLQSFDEHLSLKMPVSFDPVTEMPVEQLPPEARERVQKATQRTAHFNGVAIAVFHATPVPGVVAPGEQYYGVQSALDGAFWSYYPRQTPPKIDWGPHNDDYQSGAISFAAIIGGKAKQFTVLAIASKSDGDLWTIIAGGSGEAAELAGKTAREFTFK